MLEYPIFLKDSAMNKSFKTLFTLFLGILFIIPTFTANSLAGNINQDRLIELKDIYEKGGISEAEYNAAKKIFSSKVDTSNKKIKKAAISVYNEAVKSKTHLRNAAYIVAMERVLDAMKDRGEF